MARRRALGSDRAALSAEVVGRLPGLRGASTEAIRAERRVFSERLADWPAADVIAMALRVLQEPGPAARLMAYELVANHRAALARLRAADLERFGQGLDGWGAVDTFACTVAGPVWRARQVADRRIHRWARSPDRWKRRAALVSTVPLNVAAQGGQGDPERTLGVCRLLIADRDDMVVKGLSWALRALAKRDPEAVGVFLAEHEHQLAARVLREVRNQLNTGLKNPGPRSRRSRST